MQETRPFRSQAARGPLWIAGVLSGVVVFAASGHSQFGNAWVSFTQDSSMLGVAPSAVSNNNTEVDFAWGDVDSDGDVDLVVVRKQPFTSTGKRTNLLLMNEGGVLQDRTAVFARSSDVPGDNGFQTPTNDRDVLLADLTGDGRLDVVTATAVSDGDPKHVGHPRIYRNLGGTGAGWLGFRHEDARIPQLFTAGGLPANPRFAGVAAGDLTGDGALDLYFVDHDSSGSGGAGQPGALDLNDRLLVNDGSGFFADESFVRMSSTMLKSAFGMAVEIEDVNLDGVSDVVKDTALMSPQYVAVSYNDPSNEGFFNIFDSFHTNAPYHVDVGDLNNDGRPDVVVTDVFADRYRYNTGVDAFGRVVWSSSKTFQFLSGSDDGFGGNNLIVDLDGDGWKDVIICDVDVDVPGCSRRIHVYHNPGGAVGSQITLLEERQQAGAGGWLGAVGLGQNDLTGGYDAAVFDLDGDSDLDMVLGRCSGTFVWLNQVGGAPPICGNVKYGVGLGGANIANLDSTSTPASGTVMTLDLSGFNGNGTAILIFSGTQASVPFLGGTLLLDFQNPLVLLQVSISGGSGSTNLFIPNGVGGFTAYGQAAMPDGSQSAGWALSCGLAVTVCDGPQTGPGFIPAGDDCWTTGCGFTKASFCDSPIPAGFFDPLSEAFFGSVRLQGRTGVQDTMVQRMADMDLPSVGASDTTPIQVVHLDLESCEPIAVKVQGQADQLWDVQVTLSSTSPSPPGTMNVGKTHPNGGTFQSDLFVQPVFTFTMGASTLVLDTGAPGTSFPPDFLRILGSAPWVHQLNASSGVAGPVCGTNFVPGLQEDPLTGDQCCRDVCHVGATADHCIVVDTNCSACPSGACCLPDGSCVLVSATMSMTAPQVCAALGGTYQGDGTDCTTDSDGDGLLDVLENRACCEPKTPCDLGTHPLIADTDGDGVDDGAEVANGTDPCNPLDF